MLGCCGAISEWAGRYEMTEKVNEQLKQELAHLTEPVFLVGDGSVLTYKTLSGDVPNLIMPPEHRMHQRAVGVALLAAQKQAAGETGDGAALTPNYLRLSQAERERLEREQQNS